MITAAFDPKQMEPALLAETLAVVQQLAGAVADRGGACRVVAEAGELRGEPVNLRWRIEPIP